MSKRVTNVSNKNVPPPPVIINIDPTECPFREFRDNELHPEFWGMGPAAFKAYSVLAKQPGSKPPVDSVWTDDQAQPLPRSVRQYLDGWIRAEQLAETRWESEVVIFELLDIQHWNPNNAIMRYPASYASCDLDDKLSSLTLFVVFDKEESNGGKMSVADMQLSHAQVLLRSSFCREVLSACFMLEKADISVVEHQWENFTCSYGPEGWRAKYHIYSPGLKPGGGSQHRPVLSKNGCYLIRLYFLGAWRCVWVSDQVPVDATGAPLLPFSPLLSKTPTTKPGAKQAAMVTAQIVYLWPLLLCKALLKLAAPDMNSDEYNECLEDEKMPYFNVLHTLTGAMNINYKVNDEQSLWELLTSEVPVFTWDDDDETHASTLKSKSTKKATGKEATPVKTKGSMVYVVIRDSKEVPPYDLPGVTPGFEMNLLVTMARDLPLKRPLPEPEVALWKYYRWVDWARSHGLYEDYDCPRTRYLKANGLMKLSYAPHLLDVQSTESITVRFVKAEQSKTYAPVKGKGGKESKPPSEVISQQMKEELREWLRYDAMYELIITTNILYYPSAFEITSAASNPPIRVTKVPLKKAMDVQAPKYAPLYLQIDGPETNTLKISLSILHPRILANSGILMVDSKESAYLVLERFEWFKDSDPVKPKAYVKSHGYDSVELKFEPGRHFCRIWVNARMNWHIMLLSESRLQLGPRDQIQCAAARECPWISKFLLAFGTAFSNWLRINRSNHFLPSVQLADQEFFKHYYPDLPWKNEIVGYDRALLHWMFRQALQVYLFKRLQPDERRNTYTVLRKYFLDPNFGLPPTPLPTFSVRAIANLDPCDCMLPEIEEIEMLEEQEEEVVEQEAQVAEESPKVSLEIMQKLLMPPKPPITSNVCDLATEELPCGILKQERSKVIRKHEAATVIQAFWRGNWARKCLNAHVVVTPEILRTLQDAVYGSQECVMGLMNEFFSMYPGTKHAYSISSALSGVYGLHQYHGTSPVTAKCKWVPFFQGVFYCHADVKVHFDISSSLEHVTIAVYDNDTREKLPQAFNAYKTFNFSPNKLGFTVMGHGSLEEASGIRFDVHWQLTVLSSLDGAFHVCDNEITCKEMPLAPATKIHFDEIFLPNRRNILGGIHLTVTKHEAISFRASATSSELQIVATLRTLSPLDLIEDVSKCYGTGEIFWPYISLAPYQPKDTPSQYTFSSSPTLNMNSTRSVTKGIKNKPHSSRSQKSTTKIKPTVDPKFYSIEVTAPSGWPLTLSQWKRVDEVRDSNEMLKTEAKLGKPINAKTVVIKPGSARDKPMDKSISAGVNSQQPQPGDAYVELECSLTVGGGIVARLDDERDIIFAAAIKSWKENEPGRNLRGAELRKLFREEYLEMPPPPESVHSIADKTHIYEGGDAEEFVEEELKKQEEPGPSPVTESSMMEMSIEDEEELKFLEMPELLRDKFIPLSFLPFCTKELSEHGSVLLSWDMAEAAKKDRHARKEAALERMRELQEFNEVNVLGRQRNRNRLLEKLNVEAQWSSNLLQALEARDEAIIQETLLRVQSANKKKQDMKSKK